MLYVNKWYVYVENENCEFFLPRLYMRHLDFMNFVFLQVSDLGHKAMPRKSYNMCRAQSIEQCTWVGHEI
jgi:hypothetical protein